MSAKPSNEEMRERLSRREPYTGDISPTIVLRQERDARDQGDADERLKLQERQLREQITSFEAATGSRAPMSTSVIRQPGVGDDTEV